MPNSNQFGPLDPIFDNEKKRGAIDIGNSFPSEPDTGAPLNCSVPSSRSTRSRTSLSRARQLTL